MHVWPSLSTTAASGRSLHLGCGTPITAASRTAGWPISAFSSSCDAIHSPPRLDEIGDPIGQLDEAVLVDARDVAGAEVAVARSTARACDRRRSCRRSTGRGPAPRRSSCRPPARRRLRCARGDRRAAAARPASRAARYCVASSAPASCGGSRDTVPIGDVSVMPHAWSSVRPRRSKSRISCSGAAEPPTIMRRPGCSLYLPGFASSTSRMPIQIVGTPAAIVTRSLCHQVEQARRIEVRPGQHELRADHRARCTAGPTR